MSTPPPINSIRKYPGFPCLEELYFAFNKVETPAGLMGILWLPCLKKIKVEGNPIIKKGGGAIGIQDKESSNKAKETSKFIPFFFLIVLQ
jgi:hypothetical protein